jgi:hypothetical protein
MARRGRDHARARVWEGEVETPTDRAPSLESGGGFIMRHGTRKNTMTWTHVETHLRCEVAFRRGYRRLGHLHGNREGNGEREAE